MTSERFDRAAAEGFAALQDQIEQARAPRPRQHRGLVISDQSGRHFKAICTLRSCPWTSGYRGPRPEAMAAGEEHEALYNEGRSVA